MVHFYFLTLQSHLASERCGYKYSPPLTRTHEYSKYPRLHCVLVMRHEGAYAVCICVPCSSMHHHVCTVTAVYQPSGGAVILCMRRSTSTTPPPPLHQQCSCKLHVSPAPFEYAVTLSKRHSTSTTSTLFTTRQRSLVRRCRRRPGHHDHASVAQVMVRSRITRSWAARKNNHTTKVCNRLQTPAVQCWCARRYSST